MMAGQAHCSGMASDAPSPTGPTWMTYRQAADQLGLTPEAVAARARRRHWPKRKNPARNDDLIEILVPGEDLAEALAKARKRPQERQQPDVPPDVAPDVGAAVQAAVAPLQALLEREAADRRTLQAQADALRDKLAAAQLEAASATGSANTERAKREAAEARAADLQRQVEDLRTAAAKRRKWWPF